MNLNKRVAKNIKSIRIARGISQSDLSQSSGLTIRYISRIENSDQNLTIEALENIALGLGCSVLELLGEEKEASIKPPLKSIEETIRFLQSIKSKY